MATLTDMPAEVRNMIYQQLLEPSKTLFPQNQLALFSVSNLLHTESTSFFHQNEAIAIETSASPSPHATLLPPIADKYLRFLRHLTVHAPTGQAMQPNVQKAASTIWTLSAVGADFGRLTISLSSTLSQLLNSRVDDSILDADHPITVSLRNLLESQVAKMVNIELKNSWFAPGVASGLATKFGSRVQFSLSGKQITDISSLERPLTGRFYSSHLAPLGLSDEVLSDSCTSSSMSSSPASLSSSHCSALASLDAFSVTSFEMSSDDDDGEAKQEDGESSAMRDVDATEQPFFTDDDIEEWSACTTQDAAEELCESDDLDDDDQMEDVSQNDINSFMHNMEQVAHHNASDEDLTYLVNFAPDLLLTRHHLSHLV